jgi:ribosomal protein L17
MSTLLSDLARARAASSRNASQSVKTATQHLEEARRFAKMVDTLRRSAAAGARSALRYTLAEAEELRALWEEVKEEFKTGVATEDGTELLRVVLDSFDSWLDLADAAYTYRNLAAEMGVEITPPERLVTTISEMKGLKATVERFQDFLSRPRPPVDPARLQAARQEVAQGRVKGPDAIRKDVCGK